MTSKCAKWGFPGTYVPLPDLISTTGPLNCFMTGFTQAADIISVSVYASKTGTGTGTGTLLGSISGGGNKGSLAAMSNFAFTITSGKQYYAVVTTNGGQTPRVLYSFDDNSYEGTTYAGTCSLCVEDRPSTGDCDFNDAVVSISWTLNAK